MAASMAVSTSAQTGTPNWGWFTSNPTADTFHISTANELAGLAVLAKYGACPTCNVEQPGVTFYGKTIVLTDDIDISVYENEKKWLPIGRSTIGGNESASCFPPGGGTNINCLTNLLFAESFGGSAFRGTFDGNDKTISGFRMNYNYAHDPEVDGQPVPIVVSGGLFGALDGATIKNLTIKADNITVGGSHIVAGGVLAGYSRNSVITNSNVKGTLLGSLSAQHNGTMDLGGLIGNSKQDSVTNSSADVTVSAILTSSLVSGVPVVLNGHAGGLVGASEVSTISGSHAKTMIIGAGGMSIGGLVGENRGGTITKSSAVTGTAQTSGVYPYIRFINIGGLVGANSLTILPCPYEPQEEIACDPMLVYGTITQSYAVVNLHGNIGVENGTSAGNSNVGGLVGKNEDGIIKDSYASGTISTAGGGNNEDMFGGLVGFTLHHWLEKIERNYAAVEIKLNAISNNNNIRRGGLVGRIEIHGEIDVFTSCYWDSVYTGLTSAIEYSSSGESGLSSGGVNGRTTGEMMTQSTFVGWDFDNVWRINEGDSYPYLAWQSGPIGTSISGRQITRGANKNSLAPKITVRGKTLNVRTPSSTQNLQVRLIDMRGRTATRFDMTGGGSMSLNRISAGRYIVDMRDMETGRRFSSPIVLR